MSNVESTSDDRVVNNAVRHTYRVLEPHEKIMMMHLKDAGATLLKMIDEAAKEKGNSRELDIARVKAEESVMWAVKHITA